MVPDRIGLIGCVKGVVSQPNILCYNISLSLSLNRVTIGELDEQFVIDMKLLKIVPSFMKELCWKQTLVRFRK